jgi:hypothetical protein
MFRCHSKWQWTWANSSAGEHLPYTQGVTGSIPVSPTRVYAEAWCSWPNIRACHARDRGFESRRLRHFNITHGNKDAAVAQVVEQRTENPRVASSTLACGTI